MAKAEGKHGLDGTDTRGGAPLAPRSLWAHECAALRALL